MSDSTAGDWLDNTYWYVPTAYLPAEYAINTDTPVVETVQDQTVWHFDSYSDGYLVGISATDIGFGWSYMLIVGSVLADGSVKLSFSPLGAANPQDPTTETITIGDGTLSGTGSDAIFTMQMSSGTAASSVTHWAEMLPITSSNPDWNSLPGYPGTSVDDLTGLQTPIIMPCFAHGVRIITGAGEVAVQELDIGTKVRTLSGALEPVIWIGRRTINCAGHPDPRTVWPVCVRAHAFGSGQPVRDLWLSPDHAVFVDDVLIPIKQLLNGVSIVQCPVETVTYYHIELSSHDVVLAEGLPVETYLDTGDRSAFVCLGDVREPEPGLTALRWEACGYAPLMVTGAAFDAVRRRLADRMTSSAATLPDPTPPGTCIASRAWRRVKLSVPDSHSSGMPNIHFTMPPVSRPIGLWQLR
jgi:hypothetical protein